MILDSMHIRRFKHQHNIKEWYKILEVPEDCKDETLKLAFITLAKRFHPDSGTSEASASKFSEIENAYRQIRKTRIDQKEKNENLPEVEEFDIRHTAPQHRHYLTYNVGTGTFSKRQKLYTAHRAQKAVENVIEHRLKKLQAEERNTLVGKDKERAKDIKTRFGMDRLVEDLIQDAMKKGEFNDLPGTGKPLKENANMRNPYVDFVTYKLNEVLIENGFTPEWIQLSKEIREETENLRKQLKERRNEVGPLPLSSADEATWENIIKDFSLVTKRVNKKIDKYNLLVPILQKQMLHIKLEDLANEALSMVPKKKTKKYSNCKNVNPNYSTEDYSGDILGDLTSFLIKTFHKK
ncbi:dnaJ homolog subfamily C member 28 isoform X2 [Nomia melanderi]|nr:dnaJ homolog subfamily C member 28 isoform X2 [Nomia melanderi]XP_031834285.1 dnaJ homolog subfamily C member 28 isoform X2 [Nomia melanderi]